MSRIIDASMKKFRKYLNPDADKLHSVLLYFIAAQNRAALGPSYSLVTLNEVRDLGFCTGRQNP
jgi:hypothetical protein